MDVSPVIAGIGGYDQSFPEEDTDKEEDEDLCRICRSPEEPGNPLRYPCLCRGSIKYVHQDCLRTWLNRRGYKKCEAAFSNNFVCGRSYSFVPVYSENAPERLPCNEFLIAVLLRVARYVKLIVPWIVVILFNTYCSSLHPWGQEAVAQFQIDLGMFRKFASLFAGLIYSTLISCFMSIITIIRVEVGDLNVAGGFGLPQGVIGGVVQVLWKHMKILCDWYYHTLIRFLGEPRRLILVPPNAPIHEFGFIRRLLFFLDDDAFAFLAISGYVSLIFVLLPFWIGWIVLATFGSSYLSGNLAVIVGYMVTLSISFAYFGILFILRRTSFPPAGQWFSLGFHFITDLTMTLPCLLWGFSVKACKNLSVMKDAFVICFKIGVMPWMIGCWLCVCTSPMFGTKVSQIFEILSRVPSMVMPQWLVGFCYLMNADAYRELIQGIIHKRAFWYLLDVTDPEYKLTKLNLGHTLFAFASHGVLLVTLFHLPIKVITLISPSFFPLKFGITGEMTLHGVYSIFFNSISINLIVSGPDRFIKHTKPAIKLMVRKWITTASYWLQLSDFLLVVPQGGEGFHRDDQNARPLLQPRRPYDNNPWFILYSMAEGSMVNLHGSQNAEDGIKDQRDNRFLLRIALVLVLAALSMFAVSTTLMALPIFVGRVFLDSISFFMLRIGLRLDDVCSFWIGFDVLGAICISTCFVSDHIQKGRIDLLLKYVFLGIRNGLFFSIWISVIPGLLGLLIDLMIIIPSRVPLDESPVYFLFQDWLIGVVVLHIWVIMTMLTPMKWFATKAWRRKLERIGDVGINRLPSMWLLRDVIGSITSTLLTTFSIPYLLAKYLFPWLGFSESVNSAVERLIWPALLAIIAVWHLAKLTRDLIVYLQQLVFNERYLVGERVDNLTEDL
ncbi:unnamed protein product [Thlaspi arvense]|uniref:RING-CH-type domain-containing protein n=1 Tax=Thlaspi arvense TaxID=13288 RepID=A0AAU9S4K3_THLAR|nr:unnamed protein product [Thlaspi arvense]